VSQADPVRSLSQRLWSVALSVLGLVLVVNLVWSLLRPLLPVIAVVVGILLPAFLGWKSWRRRNFF